VVSAVLFLGPRNLALLNTDFLSAPFVLTNAQMCSFKGSRSCGKILRELCLSFLPFPRQAGRRTSPLDTRSFRFPSSCMGVNLGREAHYKSPFEGGSRGMSSPDN
jgi:hypothetical protein